MGLDGTTIVRRPAAAYLAGGVEEPFDIVFADPPYAFRDEHVTSMLVQLSEPRWLWVDGAVVVERSARGVAPTWPDEFEVTKQRRYGEGMLWYGRRR